MLVMGALAASVNSGTGAFPERRHESLVFSVETRSSQVRCWLGSRLIGATTRPCARTRSCERGGDGCEAVGVTRELYLTSGKVPLEKTLQRR